MAISSNSTSTHPADGPQGLSDQARPNGWTFPYLLNASRPGNDRPCDGQDLRTAIAAVLNNRPPLEQQHPSIGCNIKWQPN